MLDALTLYYTQIQGSFVMGWLFGVVGIIIGMALVFVTLRKQRLNWATSEDINREEKKQIFKGLKKSYDNG